MVGFLIHIDIEDHMCNPFKVGNNLRCKETLAKDIGIASLSSILISRQH